MSDTPLTARLVRISGRVQGVGYRAWTEREARTRSLGGWVRNRRDGTVEALFVGTDAAVAAMIEACWKGPRLSEVIAVEVDNTEPASRMTSFQQRPTE
jgi:acylphosphatase